MLAASPDAPAPLVDPHAVYEPKYDGIRAIVLVDPGPPPLVRLWSRNGNEKSGQFPEIVNALAAWAATLPGTSHRRAPQSGARPRAAPRDCRILRPVRAARRFGWGTRSC